MTATAQRWREQGWPSYTAAHRAFRQIIEHALEAGEQPGVNLGHEEFLHWLVEGHPRAAELRGEGFWYFSFCDNGREDAKGKFVPRPGHDLEEKMAEPNPDYDGDALWLATCISYAVSGNA